jgi:Bacteriodetes cell division protein (FtsL-like)
MAKNTFISQKEKPEKKEKPKELLALAKFFNVEEAVLGLPSHYMYYALWLVLLVFTYIFFTHKYENYIREIDKLKVELDEKRSDYISKKASFMRDTKKSEILKKVAPYGLQENIIAPKKIVIEK